MPVRRRPGPEKVSVYFNFEMRRPGRSSLAVSSAVCSHACLCFFLRAEPNRRRRAFGDLSNRVQSKQATNSLVKEKLKKKHALPQKVFNHNAYLEDEFAFDDCADLAKTAKYVRLADPDHAQLHQRAHQAHLQVLLLRRTRPQSPRSHLRQNHQPHARQRLQHRRGTGPWSHHQALPQHRKWPQRERVSKPLLIT